MTLREADVHAIDGQLSRLHYAEGLDPCEIVAAHRRWGTRFDPPPPRPKPLPRNGFRSLRLGFVSQDLHGKHPVTFFLRPLLQHLDRGRFDVALYSSTPRPDATTLEFSRLGRLRDIGPMTDAEAAALIRDDGIDVLFDLCGHLNRSRLGIFAFRPAPLQLSWLAYPNTTGLAAIDFRITDTVSDPLSRARELDSGDPVLRLSDCYVCYQPPQPCPPVSPLPALFQCYVTYGMFNNPAKITGSALDAWARILHRTPTSRMIFHHGFGEYDKGKDRDRRAIAGALQDRGVDTNRLSFVGSVDFMAGLHLYARADIALDAFPYNGTTTTCESLWMGLPVIHLRGNSHVSRVSTTLLHHAGMDGLAASSVEEYIDLAARLALDIGRLVDFRGSVRRKLAGSALFDHARFARDFGQRVSQTLAQISW